MGYLLFKDTMVVDRGIDGYLMVSEAQGVRERLSETSSDIQLKCDIGTWVSNVCL